MRVRHLSLALAVPAALLPAGARAQGVYFSTESVLQAMFATSERVEYVTVETHDHAHRLRELLGYVPGLARYVVFVARTGSRLDGYAVIDEQIGQHLPITIAVQVRPDGAVARTEVMAYREAYGGEIRQVRFRRQFVGRSLSDPIRVGTDIDAITGATISCRSMAVTVRRAIGLVTVLQEAQQLAKERRERVSR